MSFPKAHLLVRSSILALALITASSASAAEFRLKLPKRSKPTPVQKLNQEGVRAVQKNDVAKAKRLFHEAYLIDPNDPFTLNNLGYIAELEGDVDRAQRYYALAADNTSEAIIARASDRDVEGKPVAQVAGTAVDAKMQVNRLNVEAIGLLQKDRAPEADVVLQKALKLEARNAYTLNNLGFAKEKQGELEQALNLYMKAAGTASQDPIVVTMKSDWRGRPISEVASENARNVRKQLERAESAETKIARLNLRGVSALNRNDRKLARDYFNQAYKLNQNNAFTLNNMGYLAELEGDRESATFFYERAKYADKSNEKIVMATRRDAEGLRLTAVAATNNQTVDQAQQVALEARRREGGPVALRTRDNSFVDDPSTPVESRAPRRESNEVMIPVEEEAAPVSRPGEIVIESGPSTQPAATGTGGSVGTATQPATAPATQQPAGSQPATAQPATPNPATQSAPATQQPVQQQQPQVQPADPNAPGYDGGLSLPR